MARWEGLPGDLIYAIGERLEYSDYVRLRAVCVSWNSAVPKNPSYLLKQPVPWLMLPFDDETQASRSFYSIFEKKVYRLELPETRGKYFRGSFNGWVVMVEKGPGLYLFNPLTRAQISLPPLSSFPNVKSYNADMHDEEYTIVDFKGRIANWSHFEIQFSFIIKIVVSSIPIPGDPDEFLAVAIYGESSQLGFCRSNDSKWRAAKIKRNGGFGDVICYQGKIWAVTWNGHLVVAEIDAGPLKFTKVYVKFPKFVLGSFKYLVGSSDGLMLVERCTFQGRGLHRSFTYKTIKFKIYKMDSTTKNLRWLEVTSIGDNVIFLGFNPSVMISSQNFPQLKGNCIYYTDNIDDFHSPEEDFGGFDIGMFDIAEGSIQEFRELNLDTQLVWPPPIWV
ncbi:hypothetical protein SLE2022_008700 [Rubroshorea leprosula]